MNTLRNPLIWFTAISLSAALLLIGCASTTGENPVQSIGITGGANPQTSEWNAGFVITFKGAIPDDVTASLAQAGGVIDRVSALNVWKFPAARSPSDPRLMRALVAAAGSGTPFTVTPLKGPLTTDH